MYKKSWNTYKKKMSLILVLLMLFTLSAPIFAETSEIINEIVEQELPVEEQQEKSKDLKIKKDKDKLETTTPTMTLLIEDPTEELEEPVVEELLDEEIVEPVIEEIIEEVLPEIEEVQPQLISEVSKDILFTLYNEGQGKNKTVFIPNKGQMNEQVAFKANIPNGQLFVENDGNLSYVLYFESDDEIEPEKVVVEGEIVETKIAEDSDLPNLKMWSLKEQFIGSKPVELNGKKPTKTEYNYIKGNNEKNHVKKLKGYKEVNMSELYEGISLELVVNGDNVEKIFKLDPGVSSDQIQVGLDGANELRINTDGQLEIDTDYGTVAFTKPIAYQDKNKKEIVDVEYTLSGDTYGFKVSNYDLKKPVYIDPLIASSYFGVIYTYARDITSDSEGNIYVTGQCGNSAFPITAGAYDTVFNPAYEGFVSKFDPKVENLLASTFIGGATFVGNNDEASERIIAIPSGEIVVMGRTKSPDFPMEGNPYDDTHNGSSDIFVAKLSSDLTTLVASTYIGGYKDEAVGEIIYDDGYFYMTGIGCAGYPVTPGDYRYASNYNDIFVTKMTEDLSTIAASTVFGSFLFDEGADIALDKDGKVYIVGSVYKPFYGYFPTIAGSYNTSFNGGTYDVFVAKWSNDLVTLEASTYLGGNTDDIGYAIELADNGDVYIAGFTKATNFPVTADSYSQTHFGNSDAFITVMDKNLTTIKESTLFGGTGSDSIYDMKIDSAGKILVFGNTTSDDLPTTDNCFDDTRNGTDAFLAKFNKDLSELEISTFIGGSNTESTSKFQIDDQDIVYITGTTKSTNFPVLPNAYQVTHGSTITSYLMVIPNALTGFSAADYYAPYEIPGGTDPRVGAYRTSKNLINVYGAIDLPFNANYNAIMIKEEGPMGYGWTHDYQVKLIDEETAVEIKWNQHKSNIFELAVDGTYRPDEKHNPYDKLEKDGTNFILTLKDKTQYKFNSSGELYSINNKQNQSISITNNVNGDVETITEDISGRYLSLGYNVNNKLETVTDNMGRSVSFAYDVDGNLDQITDAESRTTDYTYNTYHQIETATDDDGVQFLTVTYDTEGRVTSVDDADPTTNPIGYAYDETTNPGLLKAITTDPNGNDTTTYSGNDYLYQDVIDAQNQTAAHMTYDNKRNIETITDALGNKTTYNYDENGNIEEVKNAKSQITTFDFDSNNNLLTVTDADNKTTIMTYDSNNNLDLITNALSQITDYDFNTNSLLTSVEMPRGGTTTYTYDKGQVKTITDQSTNTTTFGYDLVGRMLTATDATNNTTSYDYDDMDNTLSVTNPLNQIVAYTYNSWDQPLTLTDRNGKVTDYDYNTKYQLTTVTVNDGISDITTSFAYDDRGNLKTITDGNGNTVSYDYNNLNQRISMTNPLNKSIEYKYDDIGNLIELYDAKNVKVMDIQYDDVYNPERIEDALGNYTTKSYDALNRLKIITDKESNITQLNYNDIGRLTSAIDVLNNSSSVGYDADGNRTLITDQNGNITQFDFDLTGRLETITADTGDTMGYQYNCKRKIEGTYTKTKTSNKLETLLIIDSMKSSVSSL